MMLMKNERFIIKKIVITCLIIIAFIFNTGFYYDNNIYSDLKEIEVELGNPLPEENQSYISNVLEAKNVIIEDNVPKDELGNTNKTGTYNYYLVNLNSDLMYSKANQKGIINVVDTINPEIIITDTKLSFNYGAKIDVNKIAKCIDFAKCTLSFKEKIDTKKSGNQDITIIATDESNNTNQKNITINIKKKIIKTASGKGNASFTKMNAKNNALNATLTDEEKASLRHQIIEYAKQFVGNPYVYGGTSLTKGTDCSGFTMKVYAHFGYSLPRVAISQAYVGKRVSSSELLPGDIIVYHYSNGGGHVGIYIGSGKMIHAGTEKTGIKIAKIFGGTKTYQRIIY